MIDIFSNLSLQREDILSRIAASLQLDQTRKQKMESAYKALCAIINEDDGFFKGMEIDIYPQGSVLIGTTLKPFRGEEFDLDIVLHIKKGGTKFTPLQIYNALYEKLSTDGRYAHMTERKRRCIRLNYAGDFHMDILPGCQIIITDGNNIMVPDRELRGWSQSNPKGYGEWFLEIASRVYNPQLERYYRQRVEMKAEVEELPNDDFYTKKPLQRAVQLIKRYRDIYFERESQYATSSIILTTISAQYYQGENSVFETIDSVLSRIFNAARPNYSISRLKVLNPVNQLEDFTEKWDKDGKMYEKFLAFIKDFSGKWQALKEDFSRSANAYESLFGDSVYKGAIRAQLEAFGTQSSSPFAQAGSFIIGGNMKTDRQGNINLYNGERNKPHRDFGDLYEGKSSAK